jgi:hypothetical protein
MTLTGESDIELQERKEKIHDRFAFAERRLPIRLSVRSR